MAKYMSVVIGLAVVCVGLVTLIAWKGALAVVLKGIVPAVLIFAGVIAVIAGLSELRDEASAKKEESQKAK